MSEYHKIVISTSVTSSCPAGHSLPVSELLGMEVLLAVPARLVLQVPRVPLARLRQVVC